MQVSTDTYEIEAPLWFAECFFLVQGLSVGDRSAMIGAIESARAGETAGLMTSKGTVTHELYGRLTRFGYLDRVEVDLHGTMAQWELRDAQQLHFLGFVAASLVDSLTPKDLVRTSKGIAANRKSFDKMPSKLLHMMRFTSLRPNWPIADASIKAREFRAMETLKLIKASGGTWQSTELGTMTLPYLFDHLLTEKRLWLEERNR
ncbi:hypothetical protein [Leisingera sp. ANG-M1]|uniref:hypothetical protein n=1 Tax=Leisingera sp. ANG-M1 TaxID=1577895 RepID=UPI00187C4527|nr:hypothetical protein [Leisingera sp. ANG-M1]